MKSIKLMLTGGGTGGSVTPLLAVAQKFKNQFPKTEFIWLGTIDGPEADLVKKERIEFRAVYSGKWRRYFSIKNILDIFLIIIGFFESLVIIFHEKPDIILSAGSFVSVPVVWAGWILGVPSLIHQQDVVPGLANKLMAPFSRRVTLTFEESEKSFNKKKIIVVGNPCREEILYGNKENGRQFFNLEEYLPTVLIIGGGTGALVINNLVKESLDELTKFCQIIHLTGKGKGTEIKDNNRYHVYEFLTKEMADTFATADLVITRAGMGVLTELSYLAKPTIIIPMPDSHQEANAEVFKKNEAAVILNQDKLISKKFVLEIKSLLQDGDKLEVLGKNIKEIIPKDAAEKIVEEIVNII